jgi:acetyltransferase-like isoleucine patch superfamily enzyme
LRREWLPRLARGQILFYFTRIYRFILPWTSNILLGENVRIQWPSSLLAELPNGRISVGDDCIIYEHAMIEAFGSGQITIGKNSVIGDNRIYSRGKISIGDRVLTSWNVLLQDFDPHPIDPELRARQIKDLTLQFHPVFGLSKNSPVDKIDFDFSPDEISIGNDVWIGANAIILKGVKIGSGSIVAAGAVVIKGEYPERSILAGNPAKIVKTIST